MFSPTGITNMDRNDTQNVTVETYVSSCDESLTPTWSLIAVLLVWLLM